MLDLKCETCGFEVTDFFVMQVPEKVIHWDDGGEMVHVFKPAKKNAQWGDRDAVVVFRKPNGELSYPMVNNKPTPPGCERIVMRSLREVAKFEKENHVLHEASHFDKGTSRGFDDNFHGRPF
jgi:hypothetical protein